MAPITETKIETEAVAAWRASVARAMRARDAARRHVPDGPQDPAHERLIQRLEAAEEVQRLQRIRVERETGISESQLYLEECLIQVHLVRQAAARVSADGASALARVVRAQSEEAVTDAKVLVRAAFIQDEGVGVAAKVYDAAASELASLGGHPQSSEDLLQELASDPVVAMLVAAGKA